MCCETCPEYEECAVKDKLKESCCKRCPDHEFCFSQDENDENSGDEYREDY